MTTKCDIYNYVKGTIEDYGEKESIACSYIDQHRCDLQTALPLFYQEIEDKIEEWCDANGEDTENYYADDIFWHY